MARLCVWAVEKTTHSDSTAPLHFAKSKRFERQHTKQNSSEARVCVCGGSGRSDALPLHQVLHFAVVGDAARQDAVFLPARHAPGRAEVAADGAPEEAELSARVQALCDGGRREARQRCGRGRGCGRRSGGGFRLRRRRDLGVGGLQRSSRTSSTPFHRGLRHRSPAGAAQTTRGRGGKKSSGCNHHT